MTDTNSAVDRARRAMDLRERIAALAEQISGLSEAKAKLELEVVELAGNAPGTVVDVAGLPLFSLVQSHRFSADRAAELFAANPDLIAQISETSISSAKAKRVLPPAAYELCQVAGDKITVKLAAVKA